MDINKNSLHCRIYKWFWIKDDYSLPDNLCPYFWKMVIAMLLCIPFFVLSIPSLIVSYIIDDRSMREVPQILRVFLSMLILMSILCIWSMFIIFLPLFNIPIYEIHIGLGITGWVVTLVILGICTYEYIQSKKTYKVRQPNIVVEFISAKYNKYCPKINWK